MSVTFLEYVLEEARLVSLRILSEATEYTSNSSIIHMALRSFGLNLSRDQVDTQLAWLAEQGLVQVERILTVTRATLTRRGLDVANGHATVPGIKKPGPRE